MEAASLDDLKRFEIDPERGFLAAEDPLGELPVGFEAWWARCTGRPTGDREPGGGRLPRSGRVVQSLNHGAAALEVQHPAGVRPETKEEYVCRDVDRLGVLVIASRWKSGPGSRQGAR